ncbi:hypothetical protein PSTG_08728 [Puccinia striiformis f. sp. tritici PST-78]|uniref:Uncharacterized protein n=1 Tax=Puccinia striiformis f. sp. tritici PST-78 TaxID=1165861 RepID=A0A0L0VFM6_9BASI|nr:hypothetical protein PSTG_08728 [Puccinia striiformis f. sp. tritici PST-78]
MVQVHFDVPCLVDLEIPHGEEVTSSLAITVDSETATIAYLRHQSLVELESINITLLAIHFGYREIDMIKTPDNTFFRSILGINQHQKIVFEVKFTACNEIPCGGRVPPSLAITADSETATIAYLHHQILEELGSMNITFPAKCLGYRQINMIKTPDNMLLKNILGINQHPKIVFEVKFKTCNGTTERNAGALAAIVGAAAGPVISTGIIKAMGFQAAGIRAGSPAAAWMVSIGAVQAGSLVAVFQSIGAVGLGPLGIVGMMSLALDLVRGEQKQNGRVVCELQSRVRDTLNLSDHDQRSSKSNSRIHSLNQSDLVDRIYPLVTGKSSVNILHL